MTREKQLEKTNKKGKKKVIFCTFILIVVAILLCASFKPLLDNLNYGLDLQGGFEVLYKVDSIDGSKMNQSKLTATYKTLSKRIDSLGVSEPEIITEGNNHIRVKLAGVKDADEARKQLSTVATLSFRDTDDNLLMTSSVLQSGGAKVSQDAEGNPAVLLSVKDKDKFYSVTNRVKDYKNNMIVIWLDYDKANDSYENEKNECGTSKSNCLSAATVSQGFASDVIIQGNFTEEEATNLVDLINSGSLPSKLTEISSKTVEASFGGDTLSKTITAGVIGVAIIFLILILVYHFAGFISSVALLLYAILVFAVFWLVGGVLTLPGIAAVILGIGMAVDANVITYSRIKDELYKGRSLKEAFKLGSKESFSSIFDGNATTLLVAIIMFIFGESSVKGFATMQIITIFVTVFVMIFINRQVVKLFVNSGFFDDKTNLFINVKKSDIPDVSKNEAIKVVPFKNVNFLKHAKLLLTTSIIIILVGIGTYFVKGGFNLGVDFRAGSDIALVTDKKLSKSEVKEDIKSLGLKSSSVTIDNKNTDILVNDVLSANKVKNVKNYFVKKYDAKVDIGVVSNLVKRELIKNAIMSIIISFIGIIIYMSFRFKFSFGISGVAALVHDILIICTVFAISRLEVSSMFIAAILAIIGYSINDTIVLFDRIRDNLKHYDKRLDKDTLYEITNRSIRETFNRTIWTSVTTIVPVITLTLLGSREILGFNIAMLVGFVSGTYSSIFIATYLYLIIESKNLGKPKKKKKVYKDDTEEKLIKGVNC